MNPFDKYNGLLLNGAFYAKNELRRFIDEKHLDPFVQEILAFAHQLFSDKKHLTFKTSGSTGKPKHLNFSKNAIYESAQLTNRFFDLKKGKRTLLSLPMNYVAAKMMVARAVVGESELISISPGSKPLQPGIDFHFAPFTPFQFEEIINHQLNILPKGATILLGGGAASDRLRNQIAQLPNKVYLGFGMTETLTHFALADLKSNNSFFKTLPETDLKTDGTGALSVFRRGITDDWVHTNDIVELLPNGFKWKGRKDHVINSGGVKLYPEEIERDLTPHIHSPFFVHGVDDDKLGQKVVLFIEGNAEIDLNEVKFSNKYSKPREIVLMENFLWTDSGKIRRKASVDLWLNS